MIHVHAEVVRNTKTAVVKTDKNKNKYKLSRRRNPPFLFKKYAIGG